MTSRRWARAAARSGACAALLRGGAGEARVHAPLGARVDELERELAREREEAGALRAQVALLERARAGMRAIGEAELGLARVASQRGSGPHRAADASLVTDQSRRRRDERERDAAARNVDRRGWCALGLDLGPGRRRQCGTQRGGLGRQRRRQRRLKRRESSQPPALRPGASRHRRERHRKRHLRWRFRHREVRRHQRRARLHLAGASPSRSGSSTSEPSARSHSTPARSRTPSARSAKPPLPNEFRGYVR